MSEITFERMGAYSPEELTRATQGYSAARHTASVAHSRRVTEAARLYSDVLHGRLDPVFIREAMQPRDEILVSALMQRYPGMYGDPGGRTLGLRETMAVSDYQALFVDVLDRLYYGYYNVYPIVNKSLVRIKSLRDFRTVKRYMLDGVVGPLTRYTPGQTKGQSGDPAAPPSQRALSGPVPQDGATFPTTDTAAITYAPELWQAMTSVNWQAMVNDDLGIFQDLAPRLAASGNLGISLAITNLYMDSSGPNVLLYKAGYRNLITAAYGASSNNPRLSIQGLQDAYKILAGQRDSAGNPILITGKATVWYGPSDAATAMNLQNQISSQVSVEGGTQAGSTGFPAQFVEVSNWAVKNLNWVMDPYIPIVSTSHPYSWGMTLDPNTQSRPAIEFGFLNGFETPQIFQKLPNTQRVGGGVEPTMGDFYSMDQEMKIITVFGGTQIDGRSTCASNGSGS